MIHHIKNHNQLSPRKLRDALNNAESMLLSLGHNKKPEASFKNHIGELRTDFILSEVQRILSSLWMS